MSFSRFLRGAGAALALAVAAFPAAAAVPASGHKVLVISVDGLDWRYLRDRGQAGVEDPDLAEADGPGGGRPTAWWGVWPTITWPSHTSILTGVRPDQHGVLGNQRPKEEGGEYYLTPDLLHAEPLWKCVGDKGMTTAAITWPVTKDAAITWDIPEYFHRRNGGSMDLETATSARRPA